MEIEIRILGPIEAIAGDAAADLRGPRQYRLLVKLALHPGRPSIRPT